MATYQSLKWDDVQEGQELHKLEFPITFTTQVMDASGTRDLSPIHHDRDFAKNEAGVRDVFVNTMFYEGLLGRYVNEWAGPESFLRKISFNMRGNNCPGDLITARGKVVKKYQQEGMKLVDLDVHLDNQLQMDTVTATLTLELI